MRHLWFSWVPLLWFIRWWSFTVCWEIFFKNGKFIFMFLILDISLLPQSMFWGWKLHWKFKQKFNKTKTQSTIIRTIYGSFKISLTIRLVSRLSSSFCICKFCQRLLFLMLYFDSIFLSGYRRCKDYWEL
jgi:hypothetical protein